MIENTGNIIIHNILMTMIESKLDILLKAQMTDMNEGHTNIADVKLVKPFPISDRSQTAFDELCDVYEQSKIII